MSNVFKSTWLRLMAARAARRQAMLAQQQLAVTLVRQAQAATTQRQLTLSLVLAQALPRRWLPAPLLEVVVLAVTRRLRELPVGPSPACPRSSSSRRRRAKSTTKRRR